MVLQYERERDTKAEIQQAAKASAQQAALEHDTQRKAEREKFSQHILRRWHSLVLVSAFDGFCTSVRQQKRRRHQALQLLLRWQRSGLAAAFDGWRSKAAMQRQRKLAATRHLARWCNMTVARAFEAFLTYTLKRRRLKSLAARLVLRWQRSGLAAAFDGWAAEVVTACAEKAAAEWSLRQGQMEKLTRELMNEKENAREAAKRVIQAVQRAMAAEERSDVADKSIEALNQKLKQFQGDQKSAGGEQASTSNGSNTSASDFQGCIPKGRLELRVHALEQKLKSTQELLEQQRVESRQILAKEFQLLNTENEELRANSDAASRESLKLREQVTQLEQVIDGLQSQRSLLQDELVIMRASMEQQEHATD